MNIFRPALLPFPLARNASRRASTTTVRYASSSYSQFINGSWSLADPSADTIAVENPSTHEIISYVPRGTVLDAEIALAAAKEAQPAWESKAAVERGQVLSSCKKKEVSRQKACCGTSQGATIGSN